MTEVTTFRSSRFLLGFFIAILGHAAVFAAAWIAARTAPSGEGWGDLVAVAVTLVFGEGIVLVGAVIAAIILFVRKRADAGIGVIIGGLVGVIAWLILRFTS